MTKKQRALKAIEELKKLYPVAHCSLDTTGALQLLIATRLSAQCTDARVNQVTPILFQKFPTLQSFVEADIKDIEDIIRSCGLYKTKAKDIKGMCVDIAEKYGGQVPDTMEDLISLPGVGRKTANLVLGEVFGKPAVVADTHCIRLSGRIGLTSVTKDAYKVEKELRAILPPEESNDFCHRLVYHGRAVCTARSPKCDQCTLADICVSCGKVSGK
nr:endonuclease III [uncultured Solibaculum sp.]